MDVSPASSGVPRRVLRVGAAGLLLISAGCVDRRLSITSEPSGARVFLNDTEVGVTPVEVNFTYFGVYDVRLRKDGYEPLTTSKEAQAPFHEWPGVDLLFLPLPFTKETRLAWHFELEAAPTDPAAMIQRAQELRGMLEPVPSMEAPVPTESAPPSPSEPSASGSL